LLSVINTLESLLVDIEKKFISKNLKSGRPIKIDNIHSFFSSLWHISQIKVLKTENEKDIKITEALIDEMVKNEEKKFVLSQPEDFSNKLKIVERKIIQIKLDGYETSEPYHKKTKNLEVGFFISFMSTETIKYFENSLFKFFNKKNIYYHTFANTFFTVLRDKNSMIDDYLFLDVSGEITEIGMVKDGILFGLASFPFGKNYIVRQLSEVLNTNKEEAISRASLFVADKLTKSSKDKVSKALEDIMIKWHKSFDISLKKLLLNAPMPRRVFFMSDEDIRNLIENFIKLYKFDNIEILEKLAVVESVGKDSFDSEIKYNEREQRDEFLSLESFFVKKLLDLNKK
jgi:hypothetical protein